VYTVQGSVQISNVILVLWGLFSVAHSPATCPALPSLLLVTVFTILYCRFLAQNPMIYVHPVSLGSTIWVSMNEDRVGMKIPLNRSSTIF